MIIIDLEHATEQLPQTPAFQKAIAFLHRADLATLPDGNIEFDGKRVFAMVQSYETFPHGTPYKFEAHRVYIDIQYMVDGTERMGWTATNSVTFNTAYDSANDIQFGTALAMTTFVLQRRQLVVFYPSDGHAPRHACDRPMLVKKIVIKVAV
jgi:YhcH/YjgK/YiaL family protein